MMLRPKEVVCKWVDAFNDHDVEAIVSLYHDNATNHQVTNEPVIGIEAIREIRQENILVTAIGAGGVSLLYLSLYLYLFL